MRKQGKFIEFKNNNGDIVTFPLLLIEGTDKDSTVCITAGVHGCEYPPIAALIDLYNKIDPMKIKGTLKIIPVVDMESFKGKTPFVCPIDKKNINRSFPGDENGSYSETLTYYLFNSFMANSDYYVDLHSGDFGESMLPFCEVHKSGNVQVDEQSMNLAKASGIPSIVIKSLDGEINDKSQSYSEVSEIGIPSVLLNAGQLGDKLEEYKQIHIKAICNILKYINVIDEGPISFDNYICYSAPVHIRSKHEGIFNCELNVGDEVVKGDILGIVDNMFGDVLETIKAPVSGKLLLINRNISVKQDSLLVELIVKK